MADSEVSGSQQTVVVVAEDGTEKLVTLNGVHVTESGDILQQALEEASTEGYDQVAVSYADDDQSTSAPNPEEQPSDEQFAANGTDQFVAAGDEVAEDSAPLGSSENPIQIIQQGNTYHATQTLTPEQLTQIAQVLQQQQVTRAIQNGGSAVVYNPQTNTRIIYRVVYPQREGVAVSTTPQVRGRGRPRGSRGRGRPPTRRYADDYAIGRGSFGGGAKAAVGDDDDDYDSDTAGAGMAGFQELSREEKEMRKKTVPRTRSGRLSKPPAYMVRDYKRIHHLDFNEEPARDDSDGGYSDYNVSGAEDDEDSSQDARRFKRRATVFGRDSTLSGKPRPYRCPKCNKTYASARRLSRHFEMFPDHGDPNNLPAPEPIQSAFVEMEGDEGEESQQEMTSFAGGVATSADRSKEENRLGRKRGRLPYSEMTSSRRRARIRENLRNLADDEVIDAALPRVAEAATMWEMLLAKSEEGDPPGANVALLMAHFHDLLKEVRRLSTEFMYRVGEAETEDLNTVDCTDAELSQALGIESGLYKVKQEAFSPAIQFLVRPKPFEILPITSDAKRVRTDSGAEGGATILAGEDGAATAVAPSEVDFASFLAQANATNAGGVGGQVKYRIVASADDQDIVTLQAAYEADESQFGEDESAMEEQAGSRMIISEDGKQVLSEDGVLIGRLVEDENGEQRLVMANSVDDIKEEQPDVQADEQLQKDGAALEQAILEGGDGEATDDASEGGGEEGGGKGQQAKGNNMEEEHDDEEKGINSSSGGGGGVRHILLSDGQVIGTYGEGGEMTLPDNVDVLQNEDGTTTLRIAGVDQQIPLETVQALLQNQESGNVVVVQD